MWQSIFISIITVLFLTSVENKTHHSYAEITFENTVYNFDTVTTGTLVDSEFHFTNTGTIPLAISSYKTSCGCQTPLEWPKEPIAVGAKGVIRSRFNTKGRSGVQKKGSTLYLNTKEGVVYLQMEGFVE